MIAYICYMALVGIQALFFYREGKLQKRHFNVKGYLTLCCIELILLAGVRGYTVGADTEVYLNAIEYYGKMSPSEIIKAEQVYPFDFEIGYFWLTKLCCLLGMGKTAFLFLIAVIIYIPVFVWIGRHSSAPYMSILCYFAFGFFSYSMGVFRQMIAISILFYGWDFIAERKFFKYLIVVLLAMLFHTTALLAILLYLLYGVKWQRIAIWCIPVQCALLIFGRYIVLPLFRVFPKYTNYIGGMHDVQGGSYLMLIFLNLIFFVSIFLQRKEHSVCKDMTICAMFLAICLQCLGYSFGIFGRTVSYFYIYIILAIPNIVDSLTGNAGYRMRQVVSLFAIAGLFVMAFLTLNGNHYLVPYYTAF